MIERFIIDDAGTLIDIETRNTYDYVSEVCPLLNQLNNTIEIYKNGNRTMQERMSEMVDVEFELLEIINKKLYDIEVLHIDQSKTMIRAFCIRLKELLRG